jgi:hypothetical protein
MLFDALILFSSPLPQRDSVAIGQCYPAEDDRFVNWSWSRMIDCTELEWPGYVEYEVNLN